MSITTSRDERAQAVARLEELSVADLQRDLVHEADRARRRRNNRAWYRRHREANRARQRADYAKDPTKAVAATRAWVQANPLRAAAAFASSGANRRAARRGAIGRITVDDVVALWLRDPACIDCGVGRGLDHVVALVDGGSNTPDNLANRCSRCNARKGYGR